MNNLISLAVVDGEPRVDSRLVAKQLGVKHQNTRELIEQYLSDFEEFGIIRFETGKPPKGSSGGRPEKFYLLNEDQSYLLLTYSQNTEQARELKKRLVRAFGQQRYTITLPESGHNLPLLESSLVLDYQGIPIRFIIDAHGNWMATYKDVATALGYVNKEQQYSARNILKYTVKSGERQLKHPLYGDLIAMAGVERILAYIARNTVCMPERAVLGANLQEWLDKTAQPLIAQPVTAIGLLEAPRACPLDMAPVDWDVVQAIQVFECWSVVLGDAILTTRQAIDRSAGTPLADLFLDIAEARRQPGVISGLRLGMWLARRLGWSFDGWVLPPVMTRKNDVKRWTVRRVS